MKNKSNFLVVVDVQPAYQEACKNIIYDIIDKINKSKQQIIFFYVGKKFGCDTKSEVIGYLLENGIEENKIDGIHFIEKDYGFFRSWMDAGVSHENILKTILYMNNNNITDTRDFNEEDWKNTIGDPYSHPVYFCFT
jgi:hypothetical protein